MIRKDVRQLARALRETRPESPRYLDDGYVQGRYDQWEDTRSAIADVCQVANPRCNRALFIQETNRDAS